MYHPHQPSGQLLPSKGEAVKCAILAQVTASPSRGEAARRADEGGGFYPNSLRVKIKSVLQLSGEYRGN